MLIMLAIDRNILRVGEQATTLPVAYGLSGASIHDSNAPTT